MEQLVDCSGKDFAMTNYLATIGYQDKPDWYLLALVKFSSDSKDPKELEAEAMYQVVQLYPDIITSVLRVVRVWEAEK